MRWTLCANGRILGYICEYLWLAGANAAAEEGGAQGHAKSQQRRARDGSIRSGGKSAALSTDVDSVYLR
jgi:hypothetical protein